MTGDDRGAGEGGWTDRGRWCEHPHDIGRDSDWLLDVPRDPHPPGQLFALTEVGWVPYCGWDNKRAHAASSQLARRWLDHGLVIETAQVPDSVLSWEGMEPVPRYTDARFKMPQIVLSMALAEKEGRLCVADGIRVRHGI